MSPIVHGQPSTKVDLPSDYLQDRARFFDPVDQILIQKRLEEFNQKSDIPLFCITLPNRSIPPLLKSYHQDFYEHPLEMEALDQALLLVINTNQPALHIIVDPDISNHSLRKNWEKTIRSHLDPLFESSEKAEIFDLMLLDLAQSASLNQLEIWISDRVFLLGGLLALLLFLASALLFYWYARKKKRLPTLSQTYSAQPFVRETKAYKNQKPASEEPHLPADTKIRELLVEIEELALLRDAAFSHRRREDIRDLIERELLFFNHKFRDELSEKELQQLQSTEEILLKILKHPGPHLRCDFSYVQEYIHNFMVSAYSWERYNRQFSPESIISTKAHFILLFNKTLKVDRPQGYQILNFYLHYIRKLENHPEVFLKKKALPSEAAFASGKAPNRKSYRPHARKKMFMGGGSRGNWD
ncbi:MAG: hypothetical protein AAFU64_01820 [Bacteroidota bacterium]